MYSVLERLGNPQKRLPPVIHVAGTNGKGSVCAFLRAALEAEGYVVHVYTSPHLVRFNERIRLAGQLIEESYLVQLLLECEEKSHEILTTFFEITTAAAYLAFSRVPADYLILEVGLGGKQDATNVIDSPLASVITPISHDHHEYLGDTIEAIASEKAGIIKQNVPCFSAKQAPEITALISQIACEKKSSGFYLCGNHFRATIEQDQWIYREGNYALHLPFPILKGQHQIENAALAVSVLRHIGISESACTSAMTTVSWPARMQKLHNGTLFDILPNDIEIFLDGGHNESGAIAVTEEIKRQCLKDGRKVSIILGMINSKDPVSFAKFFSPLADDIYVVAIPNIPAALSSKELSDILGASNILADPCEGCCDAARRIAGNIERGKYNAHRKVVICGSLYLAGHILADHG
jgi:dihydrofolate synthase/folylpolyglutamate synthase